MFCSRFSSEKLLGKVLQINLHLNRTRSIANQLCICFACAFYCDIFNHPCEDNSLASFLFSIKYNTKRGCHELISISISVSFLFLNFFNTRKGMPLFHFYFLIFYNKRKRMPSIIGAFESCRTNFLCSYLTLQKAKSQKGLNNRK